MTSAAACHVFSAGFSFHRKPFHSSLNEGLQNYLLRLQTEGRSRTRIDGVISTVETGDLMLFAPDDPYYLSIDKENYPVGKPRIESGDYHIFCGGPWIEEWWTRKQRPALLRLPRSIIFSAYSASLCWSSAGSPTPHQRFQRVICRFYVWRLID